MECFSAGHASNTVQHGPYPLASCLSPAAGKASAAHLQCAQLSSTVVQPCLFFSHRVRKQHCAAWSIPWPPALATLLRKRLQRARAAARSHGVQAAAVNWQRQRRQPVGHSQTGTLSWCCCGVQRSHRCVHLHCMWNLLHQLRRAEAVFKTLSFETLASLGSSCCDCARYFPCNINVPHITQFL